MSKIDVWLVPRYCHVRKWSDYNGYGFNLHAEKGRAGQYIGKVDDDSPAEYAGLKQGDRIVEINGVNVGNENHQQVVNRIKAGGEETRMLVVDTETDAHYKEQKIVVRADLPEVVSNITPVTRPERSVDEDHTVTEEIATDAYVPVVISTPAYIDNDDEEDKKYQPRYCYLRKWRDFDGYGFNLHADKGEVGQYIGNVDDDSPAASAGLRRNDHVIEVNDANVENDGHAEVVERIKRGGDEIRLLVADSEVEEYYKKCDILIHGSMPQVVRLYASERHPDSIVVNHTEENPTSISQSEQVIVVSSSAEPSRPVDCFPRYCHIRKWYNFDGYGFNLHAELNEVGQYIGQVDAESPAEEAGVRAGDKVIEINNINTELETHQQVVERIKNSGDEVRMLLVDLNTGEYYQNHDIRIHNGLAEVVIYETSIRKAPSVGDNVNESVQVNHEQHQQVYSPEDEEVVVASAVVSEYRDSMPEAQREPTPPPRVPTPELEPITVTTPEPVITPKVGSNGDANQANGDPFLNVSVAEMRQRLAGNSKKLRDPRLQKLDFKTKYQQYEKL